MLPDLVEVELREVGDEVGGESRGGRLERQVARIAIEYRLAAGRLHQ